MLAADDQTSPRKVAQKKQTAGAIKGAGQAGGTGCRNRPTRASIGLFSTQPCCVAMTRASKNTPWTFLCYPTSEYHKQLEVVPIANGKHYKSIRALVSSIPLQLYACKATRITEGFFTVFDEDGYLIGFQQSLIECVSVIFYSIESGIRRSTMETCEFPVADSLIS